MTSAAVNEYGGSKMKLRIRHEARPNLGGIG